MLKYNNEDAIVKLKEEQQNFLVFSLWIKFSKSNFKVESLCNKHGHSQPFIN